MKSETLRGGIISAMKACDGVKGRCFFPDGRSEKGGIRRRTSGEDFAGTEEPGVLNRPRFVFCLLLAFVFTITTPIAGLCEANLYTANGSGVENRPVSEANAIARTDDLFALRDGEPIALLRAMGF